MCGKEIRSLAAALLGGALAWAWPGAAPAELLVVANDSKVVLVDGASTVVEKPGPDTVAVIEIGTFPPKVIAEFETPASVVGPPLSVAVTPDESLALVTAAMRIDPADPKKQAPDDRLTVIDLKASPPAVIAKLAAGKGAAGLSINRKGDLALVANRSEGTVSVFSIAGKNVTKTDTIAIGDAKSGPSHVAITPDGGMALVTRDGDHQISILRIEGGKVTLDKRVMAAGLRPYGIDISADGRIAAVANLGLTPGDAQTVSVIDLAAKPPRVVDTISVGETPEGLLFSPDGKLLAVIIMNGSNRAKGSPFYNDGGRLQLYRVDGLRLAKVAEAKIGHWSQGIAFSADGRHVFAQNMVERNVMVFRWESGQLTDTGHRIPMKGGSAAMRTAVKR